MKLWPNLQQEAGHRQQKWKEKPDPDKEAADAEGTSAAVAEAVTDKLGGLSINGNNGQANVPVQTMPFVGVHLADQAPMLAQSAICKPKSYGTVSGAAAVEVEEAPVNKTAVEIQGNGAGAATVAQKSSVGLSKLFKGNLLESFTVDNSTYALGQVRATFYPKFENEKSDQEVHVSYRIFYSFVSFPFKFEPNSPSLYVPNDYATSLTTDVLFTLWMLHLMKKKKRHLNCHHT